MDKARATAGGLTVFRKRGGDGLRSVFAPLLGLGPGQFDQFGHFPAQLFLEDFAQGNVRRPEIGGVGDQGPAQAAAPRVQLAHATGHEIDEHVGVANLFQGFPTEFSVHNVIKAVQ